MVTEFPNVRDALSNSDFDNVRWMTLLYCIFSADRSNICVENFPELYTRGN